MAEKINMFESHKVSAIYGDYEHNNDLLKDYLKTMIKSKYKDNDFTYLKNSFSLSIGIEALCLSELLLDKIINENINIDEYMLDRIINKLSLDYLLYLIYYSDNETYKEKALKRLEHVYSELEYKINIDRDRIYEVEKGIVKEKCKLLKQERGISNGDKG